MNSEKRKVAVTGSTGFLGSHLVQALCARGYSVNALARDPDKAQHLPESVTTIIGDIGDDDALRSLVDGCEWVFHTVSNFRTASGPPESYEAINVHGTRCMLDAATAAGVKRVIHVSTIGVHGDVRDTPSSEDAPYNPGDLYQETKLEAELLVLKTAETGELEVVVVRPCSMYGPGDLRMLKMFSMLSKGTFFKAGPCQENFHAVYVDDVVDGVLKAAETPGISGEVFIIGGANYLPLEDYIDLAASTVGAPKPKIRLPYSLLIGAAWLCEKICVPLRVEPPLHVRRVRFFKNNRAFSIKKARQQLLYEPQVPLAEGMRRTVSWYREQGLLPYKDESADE
ncbi:MAG: NAD-dependent epimerase/dehydratase family protein [Gammaproteobacteria bacterium]|nr:NAD-dependent epimerase/dehydratase family protein [Gammaproteobacteria bacterium]